MGPVHQVGIVEAADHARPWCGERIHPRPVRASRAVIAALGAIREIKKLHI